MTSVRVTHTIDGLERDLTRIATETRPALARIVRKNVTEGNALAQRYARAASGPHGRLYYKRITSEMTGPLTGEWGPTGEVEGNAVGAGYRHGHNTDLEKSQDVIGPKVAREVDELMGRLFW